MTNGVSNMSGGEYLGDILGLTEALTTLCVLAVLLNLLVIVIQIKKGKPCNPVELFIINLCVSDIILAGLALPVRLNDASHKGESFVGGNIVCKMVMFVPQLTISASISSMVAIAVDRYREIVILKKLSSRNVAYALTCIWIWCFLLSSPHIYEYSVKDNSGEYNITSCGSHDIIENFETIYASIFIGLAYVIPMVVISISYIRVAVYVWKTVDGQSSQLLCVKMKIVRIVITITAVFVLLWSPWFVLFGIEEVLNLDDTMHSATWTHVIKNVMVVLSTVSNPAIYVISDSNFRKEFRKLMTRRPCALHKINHEVGQDNMNIVSISIDSNGLKVTDFA